MLRRSVKAVKDTWQLLTKDIIILLCYENTVMPILTPYQILMRERQLHEMSMAR